MLIKRNQMKHDAHLFGSILSVAGALFIFTVVDMLSARAAAVTGFFFKGIIDKVRGTSVAPSADWVKLCYMNQKAEDALVAFRP
jgi:hypothetical protein